jgi:mono/diheme cytochrome c family protein
MKLTVLIALALAASCFACGSSRRSEPLVGKPALTLEQQHGQVLFHKFCHQCHPFGEAGLGPDINVNPAPMAAFRLQVRSGLGAMPSFPEAIIPDRDLDQLLAYVDALREHGDD